MKLTPEQEKAVYETGNNIIVSAGAGSGKTAVLSKRVLKTIEEDDIDINKFIILTFTKNAAENMKKRIRDKINEAKLDKQARLVDEAYITTFDSFSSSIVKKYNYLLNIDKNFEIISEDIENTAINKITREILDNLYKEKNEKFLTFIKNECIKNDKNVIEMVIKIYHKLTSKIDIDDYLNNYIDTFYSEEKINEIYEMYENMVFSIKDDICAYIEELESETLKQDKLLENQNRCANFINSSTLDELKENAKFTLVVDTKKTIYSEEGSIIKEKISNLREKLKIYLTMSEAELKETYRTTKETAEIIIYILKELNQKLNEFKKEHNSYTFNDIELKAIELVKNHEDIRNKIKNETHEIMIDEYQDTNDIQETFISYIENNNVYMVGDIKQSIYRFRNANPSIFKNKYDLYTDGLHGIKIDMNKNFRSRNEVINNINLIFNEIMFDDIGGAEYKKAHQMNFGLEDYNKNQGKQDYNMEIYNYHESKNSKVLIEANIIAEDIIKRINNKEQVMDDGNLRDITYKDFAILIDKSKNFERVKKMLEGKKIPVSIEKDISIKEEDEIYILKNLIKLLITIDDKYKKDEFKHSFISIARSYISTLNDNDIFNIVINNEYDNTEIYQKIKNIKNNINALSSKEVIMLLIDEFDIINKLNNVGDIDERLTKLEYFSNIAEALNNFGYDLYEMVEYFNEIEENGEEIKMKLNVPETNSVKITTIHKSKGLEYKYVYLPFLDSKISGNNKSSNKVFHDKLGFILNFYKDGAKGKLFTSKIYDYIEKQEEISEKIRLFYVALTRAREKIIMITSLTDEDNINIKNKLKEATSITNILSLIKPSISKYIKKIDKDSLNLGYLKDESIFDKIKSNNEEIKVDELMIENKVITSKHYSKPLTKVMDKSLKDRLELGTYAHYEFEVANFKSSEVSDTIKKFLNHEEVKNIKDAKIYKEHEIYFEGDDNFHGFIDLLLEYDDHFDIIDYKLSNVDSIEYDKQLNGYKEYIERKYNKDTNIYLYSIRKDEFKKISKSSF